MRSFLRGTRHKAPIFSHTHVNARSPMLVTDSGGVLPPVLVDYMGVVDVAGDIMYDEEGYGEKLFKTPTVDIDEMDLSIDENWGENINKTNLPSRDIDDLI